MAFLNDLDKKISMLGQGAIQKTKEMTDSAKISANMRGLENQKKEAFEQLGKIYYGLCTEKGVECAPEAEELITKVNDLEDQAEQLREQMRKIKGTIFCPNCNAEIPETSKFCNVCGTKIEISQEKDSQAYTGKVCKNCGAVLTEGQLFCENCGTKVEDTAETGQAEPNVQPQPAVCPNCGKELREGQKFCTGCGTPIE